MKSDSYPLDLGDPNVMPEFESGLIGAKIGEEKEIELKFADDYPDKDIAGKPIIMKVETKRSRRRKLPELNDDFAKDVGSENMEVLKREVTKDAGKGAGSEEKEQHHGEGGRISPRKNRHTRACQTPPETGGNAR